MKKQEISITDDDPVEAMALAAQAERARISDINTLFNSVHALLKRLIATESIGTKADAQRILTKLGELQTAHVMILRAEEAFHDKFSKESNADVVDYDVIRRDIGRALDRIRATAQPNDVSKRTEPG